MVVGTIPIRDRGSMDTRELLRLTAAKRHAESGTGRQIRLRAGLSLSDVAGAVGRSPVTVHRWERGKRSPRGTAAVLWADLLDALCEVESHVS